MSFSTLTHLTEQSSRVADLFRALTGRDVAAVCISSPIDISHALKAGEHGGFMEGLVGSLARRLLSNRPAVYVCDDADVCCLSTSSGEGQAVQTFESALQEFRKVVSAVSHASRKHAHFAVWTQVSSSHG